MAEIRNPNLQTQGPGGSGSGGGGDLRSTMGFGLLLLVVLVVRASRPRRVKQAEGATRIGGEAVESAAQTATSGGVVLASSLPDDTLSPVAQSADARADQYAEALAGDRTMDEMRNIVGTALSNQVDGYPWLQDLSDNWVAYENGGKTFKQGYSVDDSGNVSFESTAIASSTLFATSASSQSKNGARGIPNRNPEMGCFIPAT